MAVALADREIEAKKVEVGSVFSAVYAGNPIPSGGLLFKELWLSHTLPANCLQYVATIRASSCARRVPAKGSLLRHLRR